MIDKDIERFVEFCAYEEATGCWIWTGAKSRGQGNKDWYGSFWFNGRGMRAHKFAFLYIRKGTIPSGKHLDHTCENSLCVNPKHLEPVSPQENNEFRHKKKERA